MPLNIGDTSLVERQASDDTAFTVAMLLIPVKSVTNIVNEWRHNLGFSYSK